MANIGECAQSCDYIHKTLGLLSDGPHITAEAVVSIVENSLIVGLTLFFSRHKMRKMIKAEHRKIDIEHGIEPHD